MNQSHDIEPQLDALAADATGEGDAAPAPPESGDRAAAGDAAGGGDVLGREFADQVQQMLDEATAGLNDQTDAPDDAPDEASAGDDEGQMLDQIDRMLAEGAEDEVMGEFQAVEELDDDEQTPAPAAPRPQAADETDTAAEDAEDEGVEGVDGEFQSIDEIEDAGARPVAGPLEAERREKLSSAARAVADELDQDGDGVDGQMQSVDELMDDDEEAVDDEASAAIDAAIAQAQPFDGDSEHEDPADPADEETTDAPVAAPLAVGAAPPRSKAARAIELLDKPLAGRSVFTRNLVGVLALMQLFLGMVLVAYAALGRTSALILGAVLSVALAGAVFVLIVRQPGDGAEDAPETDGGA